MDRKDQNPDIEREKKDQDIDTDTDTERKSGSSGNEGMNEPLPSGDRQPGIGEDEVKR